MSALVLLIGAFFIATWAPDRPVSDLQARWAPPPSVFVKVTGINVHWRDEGRLDDKEPIVLLHGTSSSLHSWEDWTQALKDQRRVIRFDLPGFGLIGPSVKNVYGDPREVTEQIIDRYYAITLREDNRRALVEHFKQAPPGKMAHRIVEVTVPTLLLWGGRDRLILPVLAERFHHDIDGRKLEIFEDLGHVPQEEDPARTVAVVKQFLRPP